MGGNSTEWVKRWEYGIDSGEVRGEEFGGRVCEEGVERRGGGGGRGVVGEEVGRDWGRVREKRVGMGMVKESVLRGGRVETIPASRRGRRE